MGRALVAAAAVVFAAGCSSGTTNQAAVTGATSGASSSASTSPTYSPSPAVPSATQLRAALLTPAEAGPAFTLDAADDSDTAATRTGCAALDALPELAGSTVAQTSLTGGDAGPFVNESLRGAPARRLHERFVAMVAALASCKHVQIPVDANTTVSLRTSPFDFGRLGDETTGVRLDGEIQGTPMTMFLALSRIGPVGMTYMYLDMTGGGSQLAYLLATKAAAKVRRTVPSQ